MSAPNFEGLRSSLKLKRPKKITAQRIGVSIVTSCSLFTSFQVNKDVWHSWPLNTLYPGSNLLCASLSFLALVVPHSKVESGAHRGAPAKPVLEDAIVWSVSAGPALKLTTPTDLLVYAQAFNVHPNYTLELLELVQLVMTLLVKQLRLTRYQWWYDKA